LELRVPDELFDDELLELVFDGALYLDCDEPELDFVSEEEELDDFDEGVEVLEEGLRFIGTVVVRFTRLLETERVLTVRVSGFTGGTRVF